MSYSVDLTMTPDFTKLPCLENTSFEGCESLKEVHVSIGSLLRLVSLNLGFCVSLKRVPESICNFSTLKSLNIGGCSGLEALPIDLGNIESLTELNVWGLNVSILPDSIRHLSKFLELNLSDNKYVETSSSSALTSPTPRWDVYLSFGGIDLRDTFTDHLYCALHRTGIRTFRDDPKLRCEQVMSDSLIQAIKESKTYIVVFSENYASSRWCLDELVEILNSHQTTGRLVIPVFYNIDPSVVRHQLGKFKQAFEKHQTRFDTEKVEKWRLTLNEVAHFSGYHISENRSEADIVDEVVDRVLLAINPMTLDVAKYPVGLNPRVRSISKLLKSDPKSVIRIGIHGMGGVGKTTLAKAVYNKHHKRFQGSCFLANVREVSRTEQGLVCLQKQLIGDVLQRTNINIGNVDQGIELIRARICSRKVLIVIDDVHDPKPLEVLEGSFASGSITIITTRNEDLLDSIKVQARYKVNELDADQSRQLFAQHAFGDFNISHEFTELSKDIIKRAGGLPLALKVFGSNMRNKSEEEWRWFIDKLNRVPINDIEQKLVISFDDLKSIDPMLQDIFLDIACFYIGREYKRVVTIMETCYTFVHRNIDILKKRCLITIDEFGVLRMHDLLRDMGRKIARNNSPDEPEKHSRLWLSEDIGTVLKNHKGAEDILGIISRDIEYEHEVEGVTFVAESFKKMSKLRLLRLNNVNLRGSFEQTFKDLRWLRWVHCPLECLPSTFYPQKLVILELPCSKLRTMGEGNKVFEKLKTLDMSKSCNLMTISDFTRLPCLETLNLAGCISLEEVHISIGSLKRLVFLNLWGCSDLRSLPDSICSLRALEVLIVDGCTRLEALPTELGSIESLKTLNALELSVSKLPDSIGRLSNLVNLYFGGNKNLKSLPDSICNLRSLEILDISDCENLEEMPDQLGMITSLRKLVVDCTSLNRLPDLSSLKHLMKLDLTNCRVLKEIQGLEEVTSLKDLTLLNCRSMERLPNICNLKHLKRLHLSHCHSLTEIIGLEEVTSLECLRFRSCRSMERLPNLSNLKSLNRLGLRYCDSLTEIKGLEELTSLLYLNLRNSGHVLSISKLPPNLKWIDAQGCISLKRLPNLSNLKKLRILDLTNCSGLTEIQGLEGLNSLKFLHMAGCNSSFLACTLTKRFFQIFSGFGHTVEIFIGRKEFLDRTSPPSEFALDAYCFNLGKQLEIGSITSLDMQPNASRNFLAIILGFEERDYYRGFKYSVNHITSGFIWSGTLRDSTDYESSIVIIPSSILSMGEGDYRIELRSNHTIFCGIHMLYDTEITMIREYSEEQRSNSLHSDLESNKKWLSLGSSSTTVDVGEQRSNSLHIDLESNKERLFLGNSSTTVNVGEQRSNSLHSDSGSNKNWLPVGSSSTTMNVGEQRSHPSKRLKHSEGDNN